MLLYAAALERGCLICSAASTTALGGPIDPSGLKQNGDQRYILTYLRGTDSPVKIFFFSYISWASPNMPLVTHEALRGFSHTDRPVSYSITYPCANWRFHPEGIMDIVP